MLDPDPYLVLMDSDPGGPNTKYIYIRIRIRNTGICNEKCTFFREMLDSTALKEKIGEPLLTAVPDRRASAPERRHSVPDKAAEQRAEEQEKQQQMLQQQQLQELERVKSQLQRCDLFYVIVVFCDCYYFFQG